jgi:hypothetical protein
VCPYAIMLFYFPKKYLGYSKKLVTSFDILFSNMAHSEALESKFTLLPCFCYLPRNLELRYEEIVDGIGLKFMVRIRALKEYLNLRN